MSTITNHEENNNKYIQTIHNKLMTITVENNIMFREFEAYKQMISEQSQFISTHVKNLRDDINKKEEEIMKLKKRINKYQKESGIILETSDENDDNNIDNDHKNKNKNVNKSHTYSIKSSIPKNVKRKSNRLHELKKTKKQKK